MRGKYFRRAPGPSKAWFERSHGARLESDKLLVREFFPSLEFEIDQEIKRVSLAGLLSMGTDCGVSTEIPLRVEFPTDYPDSEPVAFDSSGRFKPAPGKTLADRHIFTGGQFCLWLPPTTRWNKDDDRALVKFLDEVVVFVDRQLIYDITGKWPGPHYDHGDNGFKEYIVERLGSAELFETLRPVLSSERSVGRNDPCPCGRSVKYKKCHFEILAKLEREVGVVQIRRLCRSNAAPELVREGSVRSSTTLGGDSATIN